MNKTESLPDLDSVHFIKDSPTLIVSEKYPIYVLNGIVAMLTPLDHKSNEVFFNDLMKNFMNDILLDYLKKLSDGFNPNIRKNWFIRNELSFIIDLLRFRNVPKVIDNTTTQKIAFNVMSCCSENELKDLLFILRNVVFNVDFYDNLGDVFQADMDNWYESYLLQLGPIVHQTNSLIHVLQTEILVPNDWFWQPLLIFLNTDRNTEGNLLAKNEIIQTLKEKTIIQMTLKFTNLQKRNLLNFLTPTEELMFLMISFMGPETTFLEPDICQLLADYVQEFFKTHQDTCFSFDEMFEGKLRIDI